MDQASNRPSEIVGTDTDIFAIMGSPRRGGNTNQLLDAFLEGVDAAAPHLAVQTVIPARLDIAPCQNCGGCEPSGGGATPGHCVNVDDMERLYPLLRNAPLIAIASPLYFMGLPADLKAIIDRCQTLWVEKMQHEGKTPPKKRHGVFLCTGGQTLDGMFDGVERVVRALFWTLDITLRERRYYRGIETDAIAAHPTALDDAREVGRRCTSWFD